VSQLLAAPAAPKREEVLKILEEHRNDAEARLASMHETAPEVLYYLATENDAQTRRLVAANPAAPAHANRLLADDSDDEVRAELARKIGRLLPDLSAHENRRIVQLTIETLEKLAADQQPRVRRILAEEIKSLDCVPKHVVDGLARDAEIMVAAPILEYSPLLSDADLIEIIAAARAGEALAAIARRNSVSAEVSDAIVTSLDVSAVAALLANPKARLRKEAMEKIVANAREIEAWHLPLVLRVDLSRRVIRRIAGFVGAALLERLGARHGLDAKTREKLGREMQKRIKAKKESVHDGGEDAVHEVARAQAAGTLDEAFVEEAAEDGRRETVIAALAALAGIPLALARRIVSSHSAKPVIALCWRAGLAMRAAFKIQTFILKLPAREILPARGGVDFPMTEDEMRWHLDYFGISA